MKIHQLFLDDNDMDKIVVLIVCVLASFANGQWNTPLETGIGFIDGRQVTVDDLVEQRIGGRGPLGMGRLGPGSGLGRFGQGIGRPGLEIGRPGLDIGRPGQGLLSGIADALFGGFDQGRLRPCRATACTLEFIPARCRYTPVLQSAYGNYCLGCPEDVCETQRRLPRRQRRRRRRMRRRLCRNFGICFDGQRSRNPVGSAHDSHFH